MGWEAVSVRNLAEAKALALYETKGIGAPACMARLANRGCNTLDIGNLHAQILAFSPLRLSESLLSTENWPPRAIPSMPPQNLRERIENLYAASSPSVSPHSTT